MVLAQLVQKEKEIIIQLKIKIKNISPKIVHYRLAGLA